MKKLFVMLFSLASISVYAQDTELLSGGLTVNFLNKDTLGYKLNFGFNRIPGSDPEAGNVLWDFTKDDSNIMWFIDATSEVNFGNEIESSEDNIVIDASFALNYKLKDRSGLVFDILRPSVSASKSLNSGLMYGSPGISYFWYTKTSAKFNMSFTGAYSWDIGNRLQEKTQPNSFTRQKISIGVGMTLFKKNYGTKNEFARVNISAEGTVFSVWGDPVIANGSYANAKFTIGYQIIESLGVKIGYKIGHQDPMYQKINVFDIGVVLYR